LPEKQEAVVKKMFFSMEWKRFTGGGENSMGFHPCMDFKKTDFFEIGVNKS